jgi:hypothetical protein
MTAASEHISQTFVSPALGCLFYPDPKGGLSVGVRIGYLLNEVDWGGDTTEADGFQVSGELGLGFWVSADLQLSFHVAGGYFRASGAGSGSSVTSSGYRSYEMDIATKGPYGGGFAALTFN